MNKTEDEHKKFECKVANILKQLEYYFSDENLSKDQFFHQKISENPEGYLEIDVIMKCNKIKKLEATEELILEAIRRSKILESNKNGTEVRRLETMPLPELKLLSQKRKNPEDENGNENENGKKSKKTKKEKKQEMEEKNEEPLEPVILTFKTDSETKLNWKEIFNKFKEENKELKVAYFRFDPEHKEGNAAIFENNPNFKFTNSLTIGESSLTVNKTEGEELVDFWTKHGTHYELCMGNAKKGKNRNFKNNNILHVVNLKEPIVLGDETFTELPKIKVRVRQILSRYKDDEAIKSSDHGFVFDLLKVFNRKEEKEGDIKHFVIAPHKTRSYYRTFFCVYNNDSRDEFSIQKCIEKLTLMNANRGGGRRKK